MLVKKSGERKNSVKKDKIWLDLHVQNVVAMAMSNDVERQLTHQNLSE